MLVYDGDRRVDTALAAWMTARLRTPVLVVAWRDLTDPDAAGPIPTGRRRPVRWVEIDGRVLDGAAAWARAARLARPPVALLGATTSVPPLRWLAGAVWAVAQLVPAGRARPARPDRTRG